MVSAEIPYKNSAHTPNLLLRFMWMIKYQELYIVHRIVLGLFLLAKLHTFAFEITENAITAFKRVKRLYNN